MTDEDLTAIEARATNAMHARAHVEHDFSINAETERQNVWDACDSAADVPALVAEVRRLQAVADDRKRAIILAAQSSARQVGALVARDGAIADIAEALGLDADAPLDQIVVAARGRNS